MLRIVVMATLAAILVGCSGSPTRSVHDSPVSQASTGSATPAESPTEASPKKPKLSCVQ
jgi:hypothetical protein